MIGGIEAGKTPLEQRLAVFGGQVAKAILALAVLIVLVGVYIESMERIGHVLLFAVALAVAAVPEGLPAVLGARAPPAASVMRPSAQVAGA